MGWELEDGKDWEFLRSFYARLSTSFIYLLITLSLFFYQPEVLQTAAQISRKVYTLIT